MHEMCRFNYRLLQFVQKRSAGALSRLNRQVEDRDMITSQEHINPIAAAMLVTLSARVLRLFNDKMLHSVYSIDSICFVSTVRVSKICTLQHTR